MGLQYIVLALALTAVAVVNCTDGDKKKPETPISTPSNTTGPCNDTQKQAIADKWTSTKSCFSHLVKGKENGADCKIAADIFKFETPLFDVLKCVITSKKENKTKTNIHAVLSMMNTTVVKYKDVVVNETFSKCVQDNKKDLSDCVKNAGLTNNATADKLGDFTIDKNILGLDLNNTAGKGQLKNINKCVQKVWKGKDNCKAVRDFTEDLFKIAEKTAGGASIPISSLVILFGASLFALYF